MVAAKSWQAHAREAAKAGVAEPERKALAKVGVPVLLSVDVAKPYLPLGVGLTIWHERASNIIRVGYLAAGRRVTKSISIDAVGLEKAIIFCLQQAWAIHEEATGHPCPWNFSE